MSHYVNRSGEKFSNVYNNNTTYTRMRRKTGPAYDGQISSKYQGLLDEEQAMASAHNLRRGREKVIVFEDPASAVASSPSHTVAHTVNGGKLALPRQGTVPASTRQSNVF